MTDELYQAIEYAHLREEQMNNATILVWFLLHAYVIYLLGRKPPIVNLPRRRG